MQIADPPLSPASVPTDPASATAPTGEAASLSETGAPAVQPLRREASLRFTWDRPVAAAVFRRGGTLWCVFDAPSKQDVAALAAAASRGRADRIAAARPGDGAVDQRRSRLGASTGTAGPGIDLRFQADGQATASGQSITPMANTSASNGPQLLLPVPEPGVPLAVADPEIGDTLVVVPVIPLSTRVAATYTYPQFLLQASLQGIVVQPLIDTLRVRSLRDGVELTSTDGLFLSPPFDAAPWAAGQRRRTTPSSGCWMRGTG